MKLVSPSSNFLKTTRSGPPTLPLFSDVHWLHIVLETVVTQPFCPPHLPSGGPSFRRSSPHLQEPSSKCSEEKKEDLLASVTEKSGEDQPHVLTQSSEGWPQAPISFSALHFPLGRPHFQPTSS